MYANICRLIPSKRKASFCEGGLICRTGDESKRDANEKRENRRRERERERERDLAELFESGESRRLLLGLPEDPREHLQILWGFSAKSLSSDLMDANTNKGAGSRGSGRDRDRDRDRETGEKQGRKRRSLFFY